MHSNAAPTCPICDSQTRVTNTFYELKTYKIIRNRKCTNCGHTMVTRQPQEEIVQSSKIEWPTDLRGPNSKLVRLVSA